MTLEDVANQLLLPILNDVDPSNIELSPEKEAMEAELKKGMSGNMKLLHLVGAFSKASSKASHVVRHAAFVMFWLYKFIFCFHPHYTVKPLYFRLAIKIFVSLPLASMFLSHLYVQLDILQSDKKQAGSYHIVTTSAHNTILQHLLWERYARHLAKYKSVRFAKEMYHSCPKAITDFFGYFVSDFPSVYHWVRLKLFRHPVVEFFYKGVGFC